MTGIELRKGVSKESIRIQFMYKGVVCKETLKLSHTKKNIDYAVKLRGEILNKIERGTFDYFEQFPNSKKSHFFGKKPSKQTIGDLLRAQLAIAERSQSPSTYRGYKQVCDSHLFKKWDKTLVTDLTRADLKSWISNFDCKRKTLLNILTPLRNAIAEAIHDDLIENDPFHGLKIDKLLTRQQQLSAFVVDPFNIDEISAILAACFNQSDRHVWKFAFATGLRTSEFIALEWSAIDFERRKIFVRRRKVEGRTEDTTKTKSGNRSVDIRKGALDVLLELQEQVGRSSGPVFLDERYAAPWKNDTVLRKRFTRILKEAGVRYRNPYQTRHTFASTLLSSGENPLYVAAQMGHATVDMVNRRYGRWIETGKNQDTQRRLLDFYSLAASGSTVAHESN